MSQAERRKKWMTFNNWGPNGPYLVLIQDCDWWDENWEKMDDWFDRNCPMAKPERNDTMITFPSQHQYMIWRLAWGE